MEEFEKQMVILPRDRLQNLLGTTPLTLNGTDFLVEIKPIPGANRMGEPENHPVNKID